MGRVKLKIKRLESSSNRQITYSKRRNGILKKAKELSILCDIDIILLMFCPTGRPTLFHGDLSNIGGVIARFAQLTPQERAKRKLESLETLKKTFKKLDHDVNIQDFLGTSSQTVEELTSQIRLMQAEITQLHNRLSYWNNPDRIDSIDHLVQMQDSLRESINQIHLQKEKHLLLPLECPSQNGMPISMMINSVQEAKPLSWITNKGNQHILLSNDPYLLPHRDIESSTDASFPCYAGYFDTGKQSEIGNSGSVDNMAPECSGLSELSSSACFTSPLGDQMSYAPLSSLNMYDDKKMKPEMEINLQGNHDVYQVNDPFELPRSTSYNGHSTWLSTMIEGNPITGHRIDSSRIFQKHLKSFVSRQEDC